MPVVKQIINVTEYITERKMKTPAKTNPANLTVERKDPIIHMDDMKDSTIKSGELAVKQAEKSAEMLHESKDKAQMIFTSAMSILHITLLKEILDRGPYIPYYYVSIALVSAGLILQIMVGLIALVIANIRKNCNQHREHACEDVIANICGCKIKTRGRVKKEKQIRTVLRENKGDLDLGYSNLMNEFLKAKDEKKVDFEVKRGCCGAVPGCSTHIYPDYEYDILDRYDCWCGKTAGTQVGAVRPREKLERIHSLIESAKADMKLLENVPKTPESEKEMAKLGKLLGTLYDDQERALDILVEAKILERQGKILYKYADAVRKKRVLKVVVFWQNAINYMLYLICILNAFIAGFGLGSPTAGSVYLNQTMVPTVLPPMMDQTNIKDTVSNFFKG